MTAVKPNESALTKAFRQAGEWFYEKRHGRHDDLRAQVLQRIAAFPGGPEMLVLAEQLTIPIQVKHPRELGGAMGEVANTGTGYQVSVANNGHPPSMALSLWHELRHVLQIDENAAAGGLAVAGRLVDARTAFLSSMMQEADAFTAETLVAMREKKAGNPEYYDCMRRIARNDGPMRKVVQFLDRSPYEAFPDDRTFARALFTELMIGGLLPYRASYFMRYLREFTHADTPEKFQARVEGQEQGGTHIGGRLSAMYGLTETSAQSLMAAFWQAQPPDERQALELIGETAAKAGKLTTEEFKIARDEILLRTRELYFKDPEDDYFRGAREEEAAQNLRHQARQPLPKA